jgi:hypothetical protein
MVLGSLAYLYLSLGSVFSWLLGSGLQEYAGLLFLMLAGLAVFKGKDRGIWQILGAGCLAAVGLLLRLDHLGCLTVLVLLILEPNEGSIINTWRQWHKKLMDQHSKLLLYWCFLVAALMTVLVRNWLLGGNLTLKEVSGLKFLTHDFLGNLKGIPILLSAQEQGISSAGWFLWTGTIIGILALFLRPGPLRSYPLGLGLTLADTVVPYFYVRINAYTPRFSVHLLPLAIISLCVFIQHFWVWLRLAIMSQHQEHTDIDKISFRLQL